MSGYTATLKGGQEIYIPPWPASVALQNLTKAGEFIGTDNLLRISELNVPAVMLAIAESKNAAETAGLIKHFVCSARMDGEKIIDNNFDKQFEEDLLLMCEIFAHVVKAVYGDFFVQGLAKEASPDNSETAQQTT